MVAAEARYGSELHSLIKEEVDLLQTDRDGWNALMLAVLIKSIVNIEALLKAGIDPDYRSPAGINAAWLAVMIIRWDYGLDSKGVLEILIEEGCEVNVLYPNGQTLMMLAAEKDNSSLLYHLANAGANKDSRDRFISTLLFSA